MSEPHTLQPDRDAAETLRPVPDRRRAAEVRGYAVAMIAAAIALRAWTTFSGYFYWDDYLLAGRAARIGLSPGLLLYDHDGHFMPGGMFVSWLVTRLAPMSFALPAVLMVLAQAASAVLFYRLLDELFGPRRLLLVPLAFYVLSPLTLPSSVWFAAALNLLPMQIAGSLLCLSLVRNARRPARRHVAGASAAYLLGLLFFEKSLLLLVAAAGLAYLVADPTVPGAWRRAYRQQSRLAAPLVVLTLGYLVVYSARMSPRTRLPDSATVLWQTLRRGLADTVAPALVGGPLSWTPVGWGAAIAEPPTWLVWTATGLSVLLVSVTCLLRRRARVAWALAAGYVLIDLAVFALTRSSGPSGALVVQSMRYTADAVLVLALALGWALMAPRGATDEEGTTRWDSWVVPRRSAASVVAALAALAMLAGSAVSTVRFTRIWHDNASRPYITDATRSLRNADPSVPLLDQPVPTFVLFGLARPYHLVSWVFAPLDSKPPIGPPTTKLQVLDDRGRLVPGLVVPGRTAKAGPVAGCGWRVSAGSTVIPLDGPLFTWDWTVQVGYLAGSTTTATVRVGYGREYDVTFRPGLNELFLSANGGGNDVTVHLDDPTAPVCVGGITVGLLSRAPGG